MSKTIFALHTGFVTVDPFRSLFNELLPGVRVVNIVDDSLLADVRSAGKLTPSVTRRVVGYGLLAQSGGADAILNCCSSVGEAADLLREILDIPVVKIDEPMAVEAVKRGSRIGVVATVVTTLDPTERLIRRKARESGATVAISRHLVEGAFDSLVSGDSERHDQLVIQEIERAVGGNDVVVLAQGSMARLVPHLSNTPVPLLSSPRSGISALKEILDGLA